MTTEKAPVAGGSGNRLTPQQEALAQAIAGPNGASGLRNLPSMREINEIFGRGGAGSQQSTPDAGTGSGAAAAAGVLTAIDEDQEGDEEAPMPDAFDYHTDAEEDE